MTRTKVALALAGALLVPLGAAAAPTIREQQVRFQEGETGVTLQGKLEGDETVDYKVHAAAGQGMAVVFRPSNRSAYFNVLPPGSDEALFVGSSSGDRFEGDLPAEGVYTIRVYLMRNAARRNERTSYELEVGVTGKARAAVVPSSPAPPR
jgi:hypothetical protein